MASIVEVQNAASSAYLDTQRLIGLQEHSTKFANSRSQDDLQAQQILKKAKQIVVKYQEEAKALKDVRKQSSEWGVEEKNRMIKEIDMGKEVFKAELEEMVDQLRNSAQNSICQIQDAQKEYDMQMRVQQKMPQSAIEKVEKMQMFILQQKERLDKLRAAIISQVKQSLPYQDFENEVSSLQLQNINQQLYSFQEEVEEKRQGAYIVHSRVSEKIQRQQSIRTEGLNNLQDRLAQLAQTLGSIKRDISQTAAKMNVRVYQCGSRITRLSEASYCSES
eukprot:TRINITY_DN13047_c0_g1_i1.p1 TRINITY_DN13047_c0_g1~~TRINITY_DN13047_c0_g1_i1.p1  ORF type:complete len:277 (-),score=39.83 TRINITY_DN13047_c0_g1_i1:948-1778(-)